MKKNIRIIMTDLDGTLLMDDKTVSGETIESIRKVKEKGILFGIATGRTLPAVEYMIKEWGIAEYVDLMVGVNGAQYFDKDGTKEITNFLDSKYMMEIIDKCNDENVNILVYDGMTKKVYSKTYSDEALQVAKNNHFELKAGELCEIIKERKFEKILLSCPPDYMNKLKEEAAAWNTENYRGFCTGPTLYEFMDPIISKSYGVRKVCSHHGFTMDNVMAFGDTSNDIEMLRDAGIGICMGNGSDDCKEAADIIIGSNNENAIADYLDEYFK